MIPIPAIDIKGGKVVRLIQGKYEEEMVYSDDPIKTALRWHEKGADLLHIVDLDGALHGELRNLDVIKEIAEEVDTPIQLGGGIRSYDDAEKVLNAGIERVILGTKACEDKRLIEELVKEYLDRVIVGVDARDGLVAIKGWTETTQIKAIDFVKEIETWGVKTVVYTDIAKDGMMVGPNLQAYERVLEETKTLSIIASGGVSSIVDLSKLNDLRPRGLYGAIIGKALYEKKIDLKEAIDLLGRS